MKELRWVSGAPVQGAVDGADDLSVPVEWRREAGESGGVHHSPPGLPRGEGVGPAPPERRRSIPPMQERHPDGDQEEGRCDFRAPPFVPGSQGRAAEEDHDGPVVHPSASASPPRWTGCTRRPRPAGARARRWGGSRYRRTRRRGGRPRTPAALSTMARGGSQFSGSLPGEGPPGTPAPRRGPGSPPPGGGAREPAPSPRPGEKLRHRLQELPPAAGCTKLWSQAMHPGHRADRQEDHERTSRHAAGRRGTCSDSALPVGYRSARAQRKTRWPAPAGRAHLRHHEPSTPRRGTPGKIRPAVEEQDCHTRR
jgi:hypothetical protein